jgi:hypothetical protein
MTTATTRSRFVRYGLGVGTDPLAGNSLVTAGPFAAVRIAGR